MSKRYKLKRRERFYRRQRQCQHEGCKAEGIPCRLVDYASAPPEELTEYFCALHAPKKGYCRCCGEFWGGVESFDFDKSGLCPHCKGQLAADFAEPEDDDYSDYPDKNYAEW